MNMMNHSFHLVILQVLSYITCAASNRKFYVLSNALNYRYESSTSAKDKKKNIEIITKTDKEENNNKRCNTLESLSKTQSTFKTLDGISHETYQRTHSNPSSSSSSLSVSGRASRNAERLGCTADALYACQLCDGGLFLEDYKCMRNVTLANDFVKRKKNKGNSHRFEVNVNVCILWDEDYKGGAGILHGGINGITMDDGNKLRDSSNSAKGRILVVIEDDAADNLISILPFLDVSPIQVRLKTGLIDEEVASVHPGMWKYAGKVMQEVQSVVSETLGRNVTDIAIHFVGRSISAGIGSIAAAIAEGALPMPNIVTSKKSKIGKESNNTSISESILLSGWATGRCSALCIGPPPSYSPNVQVFHITSVVHGDDIVCRTTQSSINSLCNRIHKYDQRGMLTKNSLGWMSDIKDLTLSGIKAHAHGSAGEEMRLALPGKTFLIRPRRLHGKSSMHPIATSGREAIRAAILWQMGDILLSNSFWIHHGLDAYIHGLDRVQLIDLAD